MNDNTKNEVWKTISNHKSYQVSNLGRVRSLNYNRKGETRILSQLNNTVGYKFVILNNKTCYVHRLVA